jgi:hypothetical protein
MGLGIYTEASESTQLSDGDRSSPLQVFCNGRFGESKEILLYVRSDSDILTYSDITIQPVLLTAGKDLISTETFYWKLKAGSSQPTAGEWASITAGSAISISTTLSSSGEYSPFWLKVKVPTNATTSSYTHVGLQINATET